MNEQRVISKRNDVSLKVLKEPEDEFDTILGMDGRPRLIRKGNQSIRRIEEVFDEMDDLTGEHAGLETVPHALVFRPPAENVPAAFLELDGGKPPMPHPKNPLVIWNLSDLFSLCGPLVTIFFAAQVVSSLTLTHLTIRYLEIDHQLSDGLILLLVCVLDGIAFALYRGRIYTDWSRPLVWLTLLTVLPGVVAFVWCKVLSFG